MFDDDVNAIMHSFFLNMQHNISNNIDWIEDEEDAKEMAENYLTDYSSVIAENINGIKDKHQLMDALNDDLIETAWLLQVLLHYRSELQRNLQLEEESSVQELMHEQRNKQEPKPNPIYKLIKENNVPHN